MKEKENEKSDKKEQRGKTRGSSIRRDRVVVEADTAVLTAEKRESTGSLRKS